MKRGDRGSTLVMALFVSVILLIVGLGFLGQREGQYRAAQEQLFSMRAKMLAEAGIQDALGKLAKDIEYPPIRANDQGVFSYSEDMLDSSGDLVGSFRVSIDTKYKNRPYEILLITSEGILGDPTDPQARVTRDVEIDIAPLERKSGGGPNPNLFQLHYTRTNSF
jgi:hypothetical protein